MSPLHLHLHLHKHRNFLLIVVCWLGSLPASSSQSQSLSPSQSSPNQALLVDTSRYWFNYRHASNPLLLLPLLLNSPSFPDPSSSIGVWLGDDVACNERNAWKAGVTAEGRSGSSSGRSSGMTEGTRQRWVPSLSCCASTMNSGSTNLRPSGDYRACGR